MTEFSKGFISTLTSLFEYDLSNKLALIYKGETIGYIDSNKIKYVQEAKCDVFLISDDKVIITECDWTKLTNGFAAINNVLKKHKAYPMEYSDIKPIYDLKLDVISQIDRNIISFFGLPKYSIHVIGFDTNGIWFSKRSESKTKDPLYFDNMATGGVEFKESVTDAMQKELREECNLMLPENFAFDNLFVLRTKFERNNDLIDSRIITLPLELKNNKPEVANHEVDQFEFIKFEELGYFLQNQKVRTNTVLIILYFLFQRNLIDKRKHKGLMNLFYNYISTITDEVV